MLENQIIATNGKIDFWYFNGIIYRGSSNAPLNIYGLPSDARWECSYKHWLRYKDIIFTWLSQVKCEHNQNED